MVRFSFKFYISKLLVYNRKGKKERGGNANKKKNNVVT